jgi:Tfp pilus assembly protein PilO
MPIDPDRDGWHLDKKVPISIIMALCVQAALGLLYISDIKKDVEVLKSQMATQHDRDERQDKQAAEVALQVRAQLERVEAKLDRLIEKQVTR